MDAAKLVGAIPLGIEHQLAIQFQVIERLREWVKADAFTNCLVVRKSLLFVEAFQVAADQRPFQTGRHVSLHQFNAHVTSPFLQSASDRTSRHISRLRVSVSSPDNSGSAAIRSRLSPAGRTSSGS